MPGIPENITIAGRTPATIKGNLPPLINTAEAARGGFRAGDDTGGGADPVGLFFQDNFNDQADWDATIAPGEAYAAAGATLPTGWDAARTTAGWAPSRGAEYSEGFESLYVKSGSEFTRSGTGKALVAYRSARESSAWWGDKILCKFLPEGTKSVFVRFWIRYQPGWTNRGQTKIFRVQGADMNENIWNSSSLRPGAIWDFQGNSYGSRNFISRRSSEFGWTNPPMVETRQIGTGGDSPLDWRVDSHDLDNNGTPDNYPQLRSAIDNSVMTLDGSITEHSEFMGSAWHKMEFYMEMNSAAGEQDGKFVQWVDDQLVHRNLQMPWRQNDAVGYEDFRLVKLGGNDSWSSGQDGADITDAMKLQEWYAIDEVQIYLSLPEEMSWVSMPQV